MPGPMRQLTLEVRVAGGFPGQYSRDGGGGAVFTVSGLHRDRKAWSNKAARPRKVTRAPHEGLDVRPNVAGHDR